MASHADAAGGVAQVQAQAQGCWRKQQARFGVLLAYLNLMQALGWMVEQHVAVS